MYPLPPKPHSREHLRENAHLRPRSNLIGAVARVRSALAYATHEFFRRKNFLYVHTPLITASDCEGAGEMFQVTTLLDQYEKKPTEAGALPFPKAVDKIDYSKDFFKNKAYLTVSGQLAVENYCCALSDVYTFGPTFRAENSHTNRHLAEFWMIEPELAFADLADVGRTCLGNFWVFGRDGSSGRKSFRRRGVGLKYAAIKLDAPVAVSSYCVLQSDHEVDHEKVCPQF